MTLSTQPYKGARDFYPEDKRLQKYMFGVMRQTVEKFGYEEYDAPILESIELYKAKTGEEIVNEQTYVFKDRGDREVVIRPEMTPSVSRMVAAKRQELPYPLRWYSIPNLWRYERPQRGRLREHWQLNVDMFGVSGIAAEHEMIMVADAIMKGFKATPSMYSIRVNSRKLMNYLLADYLGLSAEQVHTASKLIDRIHKMTREAFVASLEEALTAEQRSNGTADKLLDILDAKKITDLPEGVQEHESVQELTQLFALLEDSKVSNAVFDITIMRGFDYYTDIVFEMFDTDPENNRAMFGGGRYDGLVGLFGVDPVPTVGFGWGDVTLANFLETHDLLPKLESATEVYVVLVGGVYEQAQRVIRKMREEGLAVAVDPTGRKVGAQIKAATKLGVRYAVFIGEEELKAEQFNLKDLVTEHEEKHSIDRITALVLSARSIS